MSGEYKIAESMTVEVSSLSTGVISVNVDACQIVFSNDAALSINHILVIKSTEINNDFTEEEIRNMDLLNGEDVIAPGNKRSWTFSPGYYFLIVYRSDGLVYYNSSEAQVIVEDDLECII